MSSKTRFGKWVVVACMGALAACTSQGDDGVVSGTELNVVFPGGTLGDFQIGRVSVTVQCSGDDQVYPQNQDPNDPLGNTIPSLPDPDGDGDGGGTLFTTDLEFENDDAGQEIWHTFMDMLGECQFLVEAFEKDGEKFCVGAGGQYVGPGQTVPVNVMVRCDISQEINTGNVDLSGTTVIAVGNFCPLFHSLEAIPDDIPIVANDLYPMQDTTEFWACGFDTGDVGEADIFAYVGSGGAQGALASCGLGDGSTLDRCDVRPDPRRVTYTCQADVIDAIGGSVVGPSSGTFSDPVDQDGDGDPTTYNGLCLGTISVGLIPDSKGFFTCDTTNEPGVAVRITCGGDDGDEDCYKEKSHDVQCPGVNLCSPLPQECNDPNPDDCIKPDVCDPATGDCPIINEDDGTGCDFNGAAGICQGGVCVDAGLCDGVVCDTDPNDCQDGGTCNPSNGICEGAGDQPDGTTCDAGGGFQGTCNAGVCEGLCTGVTCPDNGIECVTDTCSPSNGLCEGVNDPAGTSCDNGGGPGSGICDGAGTCGAAGPPTFDLAGEFRAYNSLLKPEGDPVTCVGAPAVPNLSVGGPVPPGPPVGTCTDPDLTTVPGSTTGAGVGIDTQCVSTQGIGGTLTFDDSVSPIAMTGSFELDFAIDATVDLSAPDCTTILNVLIATSSVNAVSGSGTGSVSDGGSVTLTDPGDGFNVDYTATGSVNCAGAPSTFAATVCNLAGGLAVGDNPLPLPGDPGRRFWPVITFQDVAPADGKLEMQYATGPTTTAGWAMNNPPNLNGPGTQFIATTGVQQ